jgi:hypothetical protein
MAGIFKCRALMLGVCGILGCGSVYAEDAEADSLFSRVVNTTQTLSWAVASGFEAWHSGNHSDLNGHNPGIGIRGPDGWVVGTYYNSYRRHSVYAGREFQWRLLGAGNNGLNLGVVAGGVSGYNGGLNAGHQHGIHLMALPEAVVTTRYVEAALMYIPKMTKTPTTVAVQLRVKWP